MAISALDPYYRAETTPVSVYRIGAALCAAYNQPADAFGAKGNLVHASGYHRSRAWILSSPDSRHGDDDYSVLKPLDQGGSDNDVSAFDFTPGVWGTAENRRRMAEITNRVYVAAKAGDRRLSNLREFAGTLDGRTVITFNCADGSLRAAFDSSHLDHVHGSFWRSRAANDHTGIAEIMLGAPTGVFMALTEQQQQDLWEWVALLVDPDTPPAGRPGDRFHFPPTLMMAAKLVPALQAQITVLTKTVDGIAVAIATGGGNADTAAILARLDALQATLIAEIRDAVADLGEGGAAQVRA